jgi:multidrug efflux system membrane fusion protein
MMRPTLRWISAGGLLLACLAVGCAKPSPPAAEEEHPAPVKVMAAQKVSLGEWTELLGTTGPLPNRVARVSAAVEGHVLSVLGGGGDPVVVEGGSVQAGQVIARLDDKVARANRDKTAAQLGELDEQKKQTQYATDLANIEVKRLEDLRRDKLGGNTALVSQIDLDKARISLKDAQSKQQSVLARETAIRADLKALDAQLDFYTLRAPIAGHLGLLQVSPGQTITPGTNVAEVMNLDEIDALCFVPPHTMRRLKVGEPARLAEGESATGKLVFIAVQAQPETGNFAVKVRFPNKDLGLRANSVQRLRVLTQPEKERVMIPEAALLEDQEPPAVVVVRAVETKKGADGKTEKLGKALKVQATLGVRDREQGLVEVLGLTVPKKEDEKEKKEEKIPLEGTLFIIEGGQGLHDGDAVKIEEKKSGKD